MTVAIPMITNSTTVKKGDELALPIAAKTTAKRKARSWKDYVTDTSKAKAGAKEKPKCKAKAKPKAAPNPMEVEVEI